MAVPLMRGWSGGGRVEIGAPHQKINNTTYTSNYAPYNNNGQPSKCASCVNLIKI